MKKNSLSINLWSGHQRCSTKINCSEKFGSKIPVLSKSLFNKVASLHPCPATSLKRDSNIGVFLWILRDFKNINFEEYFRRAASVNMLKGQSKQQFSVKINKTIWCAAKDKNEWNFSSTIYTQINVLKSALPMKRKHNLFLCSKNIYISQLLWITKFWFIWNSEARE